MYKKIVGVVLGIVLSVAVVAIARNKPASTPATEPQPIKIGLIVTATGVGSYQGEQAQKGAKLAQEEINAAGGINGAKLELVIEDSKTDNTAAVSAASKLIETDHVVGLVGDSWTTTTSAIVPVTNKANTILLAPLTTLDSLAADDYFFRIMPKTKDMMEPLAQYVYKNNGRRVAVLRTETPFGAEHTTDFKAAFEKLGGTIVAEETFDGKSTDVRVSIGRVLQQSPDTIFNIHSTGPLLGLLMKQARELGAQTKWIATWGAENGALVKEYGNEVNNLTYPYPYDLGTNSAEAGRFTEQYKTKYNEVPDLTAAHFYDSVKLLAEAIAKSGINSNNIKTYLLSIQNYSGGSGQISFDTNGDVKRPIIIKQIQDSKFVRVE